MILGPSETDVVDALEAELAWALHESRGDVTEKRAASAHEAAATLLHQLPTEQRREVLRRVALRSAGSPSGGATAAPVGASTVSSAGAAGPETTDAAKQRVATLERETRDFRASLADAEERLKQCHEESAELRRLLNERSTAFRLLEKRQRGAEDESRQSKAELEAKKAAVQHLQGELEEAARQRARLTEQLIEKDTRLRRLLSEPGRTESPLPAAPQPAPPPQPPVRIPPPAADAPYASVAVQTFLARIKETGNQPAEIKSPPTREWDRRLGELTATLVDFLGPVERGVMAQLEELSHKHRSISEFVDVAHSFQRTDRTWWWALTQPPGKKVDPVRHFAFYASVIAKLDLVLLTAYYNLLTKGVKSKARELLDPATIRRRANASDAVHCWAYYESEHSTHAPNELADVCQAELARIFVELYRSGAG
jgi:hypothetical protein